jgi:hypothetical protein
LEKEQFNSLEVVGGVVAEDEALAGLDDKTREKLIVQDKLKAEKVKDALEKTRLKEVERKKKQDEKAKEKTEKGNGKKTNVQDEVTSTILDEVLQPKSTSNRGTKRDSSHLSATEERLSLGPVVVDLGDDDEAPIDELHPLLFLFRKMALSLQHFVMWCPSLRR